MAILALAVVAAPIAAGGASKLTGVATGSEQVTSGTWGASASPTSFSFNSNTEMTSTVANTGTIAITQISYTVTISTPAGGNPRLTLFVCTVPWNASHKCTGTQAQIGGTYTKGTVTTSPSNEVPAVGGDVYLQATSAAVKAGTTVTMTLSLAVSSATQIRAPITTNQ
ncbi:MAG TPA: hypothetical protein VK277_09885 [Acidimicrobiales bacterium]|nr:hypothetical protein [Acidimicrobiales bacterium]